jgi:uncharacterized membrane protein
LSFPCATSTFIIRILSHTPDQHEQTNSIFIQQRNMPLPSLCDIFGRSGNDTKPNRVGDTRRYYAKQERRQARVKKIRSATRDVQRRRTSDESSENSSDSICSEVVATETTVHALPTAIVVRTHTFIPKKRSLILLGGVCMIISLIFATFGIHQGTYTYMSCIFV